MQSFLFKKASSLHALPPMRAWPPAQAVLGLGQDKVVGKGVKAKALKCPPYRGGLGKVAARGHGVVPSVVQLVLQASKLGQLVELLELSVRLMAYQ